MCVSDSPSDGSAVPRARRELSYPPRPSRIHLLTQIDRSQQSAAMQKGSDPHTARVRSVSESTGACESTPAAGDCKRELLPRAAPRSQRWHSGMARQGHSRMRVGQVADAIRVRAGAAPRVASGDPAASKGKSAGGASYTSRTKLTIIC